MQIRLDAVVLALRNVPAHKLFPKAKAESNLVIIQRHGHTAAKVWIGNDAFGNIILSPQGSILACWTIQDWLPLRLLYIECPIKCKI